MSKPVITAYLNEGIFIPSVGDLKKTLPPENKTLKNFKMSLQDNGSLLVSFEHQFQLKEYTVGASNIKGMVHPPVALPKPAQVDKPSGAFVAPKIEPAMAEAKAAWEKEQAAKKAAQEAKAVAS